MRAATPILNAHRPAAHRRAAALSTGNRRRRLVDSHGRTIRDLRLSIADRCNFRCVYCMDPDMRFLKANQLLNPEELARLASACVSLGVEKIRITAVTAWNADVLSPHWQLALVPRQLEKCHFTIT